jgi:CHAT domain
VFKLTKLHVQSATAATPAKLPLNVLQVIPDFVSLSDEAKRPFNLVGTVADLLGPRGWQKVIAPWLWSPQRAQEDLRRAFPVRDDLRPGPFSKSKIVRRPPFVRSRDKPPPQYEIIHLSGVAISSGLSLGPYRDSNYELAVVLSHKPLVKLPPGQLRDMAVQHGTRLLLIENAVGRVDDFAQLVAGAGGPAIMIVQGDDRRARDEFLSQAYAAIIHGEPLSSLGRSASNADVSLYLGRSADRSLMLTPWMRQLRRELKSLQARSPQLSFLSEDRDIPLRSGYSLQLDYNRGAWFPQSASAEEYLHSAQRPSLSSRLRTIIGRARSTMAEITRPPWDHETEGAIPLAEASEQMARAVAELYASEQNAWEDVQRAPRVLNANFGNPERMVASTEPIIIGQTYNLYVDIGPRWRSGESIVTGNSEFPSEALPQSADGHQIEVVFSTTDFDPPISKAELWLPAAFGASSPVVDGEALTVPGPVSLPLRVREPPKAVSERGRTRARGRLCVYYENNLLQSAKVSIGLTRTDGGRLRTRNRIEVDFRLTWSYRDIGGNFGSRHFSKDDVRKVGINITLNDDGGANHRILVKTKQDQAPAWLPYDPHGMKATLDRCRAELLNVFAKRQENGDATSDPSLNASNGKTKRQFQLDIYVLARLGEQLFNVLTQQINPQAVGKIDWTRSIQKILAGPPAIIQIARTSATPPQYVWPWGLLYSYPLPNYGVADGVRYCDVLKQWANDGVRDAPTDARCPFEDETWHQEDVLCPFGFWGLKHILEQPLSPLVPDPQKPGALVLLDATSTGNLRGAEPRFGIGVTEDQGLNQEQVQAHLRALRTLFPPAPGEAAPATTRKVLRTILNQVGVGYFLCHGEIDATQKEPYLGLGPNPGKPENHIYPTTVVAWARAANPDISANWRNQRPLVFINGCHTTDLAPGAILNFVDAFATLGAGGVIGTDISIRLPVAIEMAQSILAGVSKSTPIAMALHEARWALANKGNLLGLAYTLYGLADFHMEN